MKQLEFSFENENEHIYVKIQWERFLKRIGKINEVVVRGVYEFCELDGEVEIETETEDIVIRGKDLQWSKEEFKKKKSEIIKILAIEGYVEPTEFRIKK